MRGLAAVVLAAGQSTRMKSRKSKVMHDLAGRPVLSYCIEAARECGADPIVVVRAPDQLDLKQFLNELGVEQVVQRAAKGTAHAVLSAQSKLSSFSGDVLVLCGDVPLVRTEALLAFVDEVRAKKAVLGVLTMTPSDPANYGRIVRDLDGRITRIVEARDATADELSLREVNSGIICADRSWLFHSLKKIRNNNAKGEYYLTDLVSIAIKESAPTIAHLCGPAEDFFGINDRVDLACVAEIMRERINKRLMLSGVGILDFRHTFIDYDVKIGNDTSVMPLAFLKGSTKIGAGCTIENGVILKNAVIGNNVHIKAYSVVEESTVSDGAVLGPFARVRPQSKVGPNARVGNFVELKKCIMKRGAKANHLTYLGDAIIGASANVGCGTITCNYDGVSKHRTVIGDNVFVGSDTQFIAPVNIGRNSIIGAGSTITKDVPRDSLALSRTAQTVVRGWAKSYKASKTRPARKASKAGKASKAKKAG
jgi:bifunctional UDP-N-acetylglucosamine pyrophosphorylase/glucosamine-1-phosphate N-acetyltransferase